MGAATPARRGPPPRRAALLVALAVLGASGVAYAAITLGSSSHLSVTAAAPSIHFEHGEGADNKRHIKAVTLSPNATQFTVEVRPKPGAEIEVDQVVILVNDRATNQTVTLRTTQVTNSFIETFQWHLRQDGIPFASLDHLAASPSVTFTLPAGERVSFDLTIALKDRAGKDSVSGHYPVAVEVA